MGTAVRKKILLVGFIIIVLCVSWVAYKTWQGAIIWFTRIPGAKIEANGISGTGYVHRSERFGILLVTRVRNDGKRESYRGESAHFVSRPPVTMGYCEKFVAPNLLVFPTSAYNPPCWEGAWVNVDRKTEHRPNPLPHSFDFVAEGGDRLHVSW